MGIIKNELDVKQPSSYLKYEVGDGGNELQLQSHLYKIDTHFLQSAKKSALCKGKECFFCKSGLTARSEFNYAVLLNGVEGVMDIKPSVFYNIQGISKAQKKDPRQISWTVIKTGEGLSTEYTTSKNDNLSAEDFEKVTQELDSKTEKLTTIMQAHEKTLSENYTEFAKEEKEEEIEEVKEEVNPEDIPF